MKTVRSNCEIWDLSANPFKFLQRAEMMCAEVFDLGAMAGLQVDAPVFA
jgi:hypothetical protein